MQVYNNKIVFPSSGNIKKNISSDVKDSGSFQSILNKNIENKTVNGSLQFSKHAAMRLNSRDINLSNDQLKRLETGVEKAVKKGINDSLVLIDDIALVVNVKNKIVITAMNKDSNNDNVFTNIDGAVIV